MKFKTTLKFLYLFILLPLISCSSIPNYPVKSELLAEEVNTRVDSKIARYYLDTYLKGKRTHTEFDQRIHLLYQTQGNILPNRNRLKTISENFSIDFAALFFVDYLLRETRNQQAQEVFQHFLSSDPSQRYNTQPHFSSYVVLFVPGWNYIDNGYLTGSDLALPRKLISNLGEAADDAANYTNRSPLPLLHLLRESSIDRAVASDPNVDQIPERNQQLARAKGADFWRALLAKINS